MSDFVSQLKSFFATSPETTITVGGVSITRPVQVAIGAVAIGAVIAVLATSTSGSTKPNKNNNKKSKKKAAAAAAAAAAANTTSAATTTTATTPVTSTTPAVATTTTTPKSTTTTSTTKSSSTPATTTTTSSSTKKSTTSSSSGKSSSTSSTKGEEDDGSPLAQANKLKNEGNKLFNKQLYSEAIEKYTEAIKICPADEKECAKFYCNRAACNSKLNQHELVVEDCNTALAIDPTYGKALQRRGQAFEALGRLTDAIDDYSAAVPLIGEDSSLQTTLSHALELYGAKTAAELVKTKKGGFPPERIIRTYLATFDQAGAVDPFEADLKNATEETLTDAITAHGDGDSASLSHKYTVRGEFYLRKANYPAALADFVKASELDSTNVWSLIQEGTLLHLSNELDKSLEKLNAAIALDPKNVDAIVRKANAIFLKGDHAGAIKLFQTAIEADPTRTVSYYHNAQAYQHSGDIERALENYETLLKTDPNHYDAWNQRGIAFYQLGLMIAASGQKGYDQMMAQFLTGAIESFSKAISLDPKRGEALNSYAYILQSINQVDAALAKFDEAIAVDPTNPIAYTNKGLLVMQAHGDIVEARRLHEQAIEIEPTSMESRCNLGMLLFQTDAVEEAIEQYNKAIELTYVEQDLATMIAFREAALSRQRNKAKAAAAAAAASKK